ncbi:hypothetical protein [Duganella sp. FT27W]|uniref:hypothetical protein n=1 Tax=Duganella sp. FT27W TaxID=2654636 RepID=UPI00128D5BFD|nr:hypothetical protein [Duganella sp. FT27W]MPQ56380.1 hypothetical protein [Duganella sp. FT27W]
MSKQSDAQAAQQYNPKPDPATCGNCKHFASEKKLPAWMERDNAEGRKPLAWSGDIKRERYTAEEDGVEKNLRCGLGGFAVKKMASCAEFTRKRN